MSVFLQISLGLLYLAALIFLFIRINRKNEKPVADYWIAAAFFIKALAACAYGYAYAHYLPNSDSWKLFDESLKEYWYILHEPESFFILDIKLDQSADFFSGTSDATWNNTDDNLFIKLLGLLNILSGGNYYITAVLFSFFSFWGLYQIFAVAARNFPVHISFVFFLLFFAPSNLFWNSGLHKDGLIVFFTGLAIWVTYKFIQHRKAWNIAILVVSLFFLFLFRIVNAMLMIPAIMAWMLACRRPARTGIIYMSIYVISIAGFFLTAYFPDAYNLPLKLAEKQHDFSRIEANSGLDLTPLEPDFTGYLKVVPEALNNVFLRPYISEITGPLQLLSFIETILTLALFIMLLIRTRFKYLFSSPLLLFFLTLSLTHLLVIGLTISFTGSIVRYKALYIILLLLPFIFSLKKENKFKI